MAGDAKRMSHAYIICAATPEESLALARRSAQALLCENGGSGTEPCGVCRSCRKVEAGVHPDLICLARLTDEKGRQKKEIAVDQIRELNRDAWILPNEAARKVYIVSEADKMNLAAQNAALKLLEEPPNGAAFLLCVTNPALLLETVRSRCVMLRGNGEGDKGGEEARALAEELLGCVAGGQRAELLRWCLGHEDLDGREAQALFEALQLALTDRLCMRRDADGLSRSQMAALAALAARCADYLRVNTNVKHLFGLLAADAPLGVEEGKHRG